MKGRYALHAALGSLRTEERHVEGLVEALRRARTSAETKGARNP